MCRAKKRERNDAKVNLFPSLAVRARCRTRAGDNTCAQRVCRRDFRFVLVRRGRRPSISALCARSGRVRRTASGCPAIPGRFLPAAALIRAYDLRALVLRPPPSFFVSARAMRSARRDRPPLTAPASPDAPTPPRERSRRSPVKLVGLGPPSLPPNSRTPLQSRSSPQCRRVVCPSHFFSRLSTD